MFFGDNNKEFREEQGLLQRQLAAFLEIDTPMKCLPYGWRISSLMPSRKNRNMTFATILSLSRRR